jgi:DNA invertase Pin-like site-specific DNA recombinase
MWCWSGASTASPDRPALVNALDELKARGIAFISYQKNVDTTTPQGEPVLGMMANLAQFESALIAGRVKAGMGRAKAQGKRTSRAPISAKTRKHFAELHARSVSIKRIAKELKIAYGTAWNYVKVLATRLGLWRGFPAGNVCLLVSRRLPFTSFP